MNLKQFLVGLFRGFAFDGELDQVRSAARQDAQILVGTYLSEFESEAARLFTERRQHFIEGDAIDVESAPALPIRTVAKRKPIKR